MSEMKYTVQAHGTITAAGKKLGKGVFVCDETSASFIIKNEAVAEIVYEEMANEHKVRTGDTSDRITINMKDGTEYVLDLHKSLKIYPYIQQHWQSKPVVENTRINQLKAQMEARGEKIQRPKKHLISRRHPNRSIGGDIFIYLMLALVACAMAFPLVFAISSSLKPLDELFRFPPTVFPRHPTLDNFADMFVTMSQSWIPFSRYLVNTVFITFAGTFGHLIIASMAAFVLAKYDFPGGRTFFNIVVTALMFSGYVTGIPNYVIMSKLGMVDTYWALLLPAFAAPIGLFMMKQFMESMPTAVIEAAHIDGAGELRIFWSIVMPNVKPAWLTVIIFSVQSLWNTSAATVIYSEQKKTLVYALQQIQAGGIARTGQTAAVTVIVMIVPIIIFMLSQSQILETMASSGIKD